MSKETPTKEKPKRIGLAALIVAVVAVILTLGNLFLTINNRLEQNKLQLLPITLPNLVKNTAQLSVQNALSAVNSELKKQGHTIESLQQTISRSRGPLQLASAKTLINLAQLNLANQSGMAVTKALLELAKQKLDPNKNTALIKSINEDLARLKLTKPNKQTSPLTNLQQAKKISAQLHAVTPETQSLQATKNQKHWYKRWLQNVKSLFVVRRLDNENEKLLAPAEIELVKASLNLQLDIASWALLNSNQNLFKTAIQNTIKLSKEGFKKDEQLQKLQTLLKQLNAHSFTHAIHTLVSYQLINN